MIDVPSALGQIGQDDGDDVFKLPKPRAERMTMASIQATKTQIGSNLTSLESAFKKTISPALDMASPCYVLTPMNSSGKQTNSITRGKESKQTSFSDFLPQHSISQEQVSEEYQAKVRMIITPSDVLRP